MPILDLKPRPPRRLGDMMALIGGALLPLAFAPFNLIVFAFLIPALLLFLWLNVSPKRAFIRGVLFGIGFFSVGISWVFVSLHVYGQANVFVAVLLTFMMILVLSLYIAVQGYLFARFFPTNNLTKLLLAFPTLWVLGEWFRAWAMTGFPWLFLGYTQITTPLKSFAPLVSVYGVSWLVVFVSSLLLIFLLSKRISLLLSIFIFAALLWSISSVLDNMQWTKPNGAPIKVSMIQGDIPQELKWQEAQAFASFNLYRKLTEQHLDSQLIVWPEAAITYTQFQAQDYINQLDAMLKPRKITLITGIPFVGPQQQYYNAMIAIGNGQGTYFKRHLVPFGEFMPFRSLLVWLKDYLEIPMSDFSRGAKKQPLIIANGIPVGAAICYEIAYPNEVLYSLPQSQLLVTVSDDSWFGDSFAPAQHVQMAQMRALETGRYLLMSTNNAVTAIINTQGKVESFAPPFKQYVLTGFVQPMIGSTPLVRIGGILPIFIIFIVLLGIAYWLQRRSRNINELK